MARHKGKNIVKIVAAVIVILLLLVLVVGLVMYLKGVVDNQITGLYVQCGDQIFVPGGDNVYVLPYQGKYEFDIYNAESVTVSVVPNTDFEFTVNGETHHFSELETITDAFISRDDVYGNYFFINCEKRDYTVMGILKAIWGADDAEIELNAIPSMDIAKLVVRTEGHDVSIILRIPCEISVELDKPAILF